MAKLEVKKGARQKLKAAFGLAAASGSGKTVGALFLAYGLVSRMFPDLSEVDRWEKVGVLDTEHDRSLLYVNTEHTGHFIGEFLHVSCGKPFSVERYVEGINALKGAGCAAIIVDSGSHVWAKEGGLLDLHSQITQASASKNSYLAWKEVNPIEALLNEAFFENDVHMFVTLRSKQEYALEKNALDKMEITKLGMKPIQRDDMDYEFMTVLSLNQEHVATASKDNTGLFSGRAIVLSPKHGEDLYDWLEQGIDVRKLERERLEAERLDREARTEEIRVLQEQYPDVKIMIEDFCRKMKSTIPSFSQKGFDRAYDLVKAKVNEITSLVAEAEAEIVEGKPPVEGKAKGKVKAV